MVEAAKDIDISEKKPFSLKHCFWWYTVPDLIIWSSKQCKQRFEVFCFMCPCQYLEKKVLNNLSLKMLWRMRSEICISQINGITYFCDWWGHVTGFAEGIFGLAIVSDNLISLLNNNWHCIFKGKRQHLFCTIYFIPLSKPFKINS